MEQYIKKSTLVAEIERRINEINLDSIEDWRYRLQRERDVEVMKNILSLVDTLGVKEVDLDYIKDELDKIVKIYKPDGDFGWGTLYNIATHFFELGMGVSNKV